MKSRILLYSTLGWPSAARYAGGFEVAGCSVHALCPKNAPAAFSRYVETAHRYNPLAPIASLSHTIAVCAPDLIVACDDRAVAQMLRLYEKEKKNDSASGIRALITRSLGAPENYGRVISRNGSLAEMRARGVRIPDTFEVPDENTLEARLAEIGLPAVLKADGSWGGDGVVVAHTREEARAAFRKLSRAPSRLRSLVRALRRRDPHFFSAAVNPKPGIVCIQHFIAGRPAASAFAAHDGKVVAMFHYDVLVADGMIGPPNVIRYVESAEMDRAVEEVAACFGLSGLHGLDFIRDESGLPHLIEINPRATQGGTLPFGPGHDLPGALAQTLTSAPVALRPAIANDVVAFFPREWRRDPTSRYIRDGYHDVPWDDPDVFRVMQGLKPARRRAVRPAQPDTLSISPDMLKPATER